MGAIEVTQEMLAAKFASFFPHLDERQRRLLMGAEARALGHGGIRLVARAAGVREATVSLGVTELDSGAEPLGRARRPGGGRKRAADVDPGLRPALLALVEPDERGDPMSPLRWTAKSTRKLAAELTAQGHKVSARTRWVSCCGLRGSACRATPRPLRVAAPGPGCAVPLHQRAGPGPPGRRGPGDQRGHQEEGAGRRLRQRREGSTGPKASPVPVRTHDFLDEELGKAVPYGVYDVAANAGWVNVGTDHDTAAFAVESIRRWWKAVGAPAYPWRGGC